MIGNPSDPVLIVRSQMRCLTFHKENQSRHWSGLPTGGCSPLGTHYTSHSCNAHTNGLSEKTMKNCYYIVRTEEPGISISTHITIDVINSKIPQRNSIHVRSFKGRTTIRGAIQSCNCPINFGKEEESTTIGHLDCCQALSRVSCCSQESGTEWRAIGISTHNQVGIIGGVNSQKDREVVGSIGSGDKKNT